MTEAPNPTWVDTETDTVYRGEQAREAAREARRQAQAAERKRRALELLDIMSAVCEALTELAVRLLGGPPADALSRLIGRTGAAAVLRGSGRGVPAYFVDEQRDQIGFDRAPAAVPAAWSTDLAHLPAMQPALAGEASFGEALTAVQADQTLHPALRAQAAKVQAAVAAGASPLDAINGDIPKPPGPVPDAERTARGAPFGLPANAQGVPQQRSVPLPGGDEDTAATWPDRMEMQTSV